MSTSSILSSILTILYPFTSLLTVCSRLPHRQHEDADHHCPLGLVGRCRCLPRRSRSRRTWGARMQPAWSRLHCRQQLLLWVLRPSSRQEHRHARMRHTTDQPPPISSPVVADTYVVGGLGIAAFFC
ncbi:hypothetical protein CGRA01v4_07424 [Colletotrichum graminicola]|nr:hypothetical protein CGRA01v4_07424 [Colletotrichum graminicola]